MGDPDWVLTIFVPSLALVITNVMWSSPIKAILEARKSRDLGELNPIPSALTVVNCVGWIIYSLMKKDLFIFFANLPGLLIGLFCTLTAMTILAAKTKPFEELCSEYMTLEYLMLFAFMFWSLMALISQFAFTAFPESQKQPQLFIGYLGTCCAIMYYAAPLTTLVKVIRTKDASSMYLPMILTNFVNAFLWTVYGFAIGDVNVFGPNVLGVALACFQAAVMFMYYKKPTESTALLGGGDGVSVKSSTSSGRANSMKRHFSLYLGKDDVESLSPPADTASNSNTSANPIRSAEFDDYLMEETEKVPVFNLGLRR